jgi:hypothetical protein
VTCETCGLRHPSRPCFYDRLREALGELEPTEREDRILRWLSGFDGYTVEPIAELFERLRGVG